MIGERINKNIKRPSKEVLEQLAEFATTDLCDGAIVFNAMDYEVKPRITNRKIIGPAVTVKLPIGASIAAAEAIKIAQKGDILVIGGHGVCDNALWGDHRSFCAKLKGIQGVVIDGAFRDVEGNKELDFPIYAKACCCGAASKNSIGEINVPIQCAGVIVNPGDIIVGDVNGVVVIDPEEAEAIMENARKKMQKQAEIRKQMLETGMIESNLYK